MAASEEIQWLKKQANDLKARLADSEKVNEELMRENADLQKNLSSTNATNEVSPPCTVNIFIVSCLSFYKFSGIFLANLQLNSYLVNLFLLFYS